MPNSAEPKDSKNPPPMPEDFPAVDHATWRRRVEGELKGKGFDDALVSELPGGLRVQPLYVEVSGSKPSGPTPARRRTSAAPWRRGQEYGGEDLGATAEAIRLDLDRGVDLLWLGPGAVSAEVSQGGLGLGSVEEFWELLGPVDLTRVALSFESSGHALLPAALWFAAARRQGVSSLALQGCLGADPLGALARDGRLPLPLDGAWQTMADLATWCARSAPGVRSVLVSSRPYHEAGATEVDELALLLATGVEYLRRLTAAGLPVPLISQQMLFSVAIGRDVFLEVAKVRALRELWARIVAVCGGEGGALEMRLHARTSTVTTARRDPWLNLLRGAAGGFAAAVAGVDSLVIGPFDETLGVPEDAARRHAICAQHVLAEEAHLARVADPAGGSYALEALTDELCHAAWETFREIEAAGGLAAALASGWVAERLDRRHARRRERIARRVSTILGVSEYPNLDEVLPVREPSLAAPSHDPGEPHFPPALAAARLGELTEGIESGAMEPGYLTSMALAAVSAGATTLDVVDSLASLGTEDPPQIPALPRRPWDAPFEELRAASDQWAKAMDRRPRVFLASIGPLAEYGARADFVANAFATAGVEALRPEPVDGGASDEELLAAFAAVLGDGTGVDGAVLCGTDGRYAERVPELVPRLRQAGARWIFLAGRPGEEEGDYRDAGVDTFLFLGGDLLAVLEAFLGDLGVIR